MHEVNKCFGGIFWEKLLRYYDTKALRSNRNVGGHYRTDTKIDKEANTNYNSNMMNYKLEILRKNRTFFTKSKILEKVVKRVQDDKKTHAIQSKKFLVPYCLSNLVSFKKAAFTLAEVLITLGIIGIVAALTIPTLVSEYQKKQTVTALRKSYATLQQALLMSQNDNGPVESWDTSLNGNEFFVKYIADYVKSSANFTSAELWKLAPRYMLNGSVYNGTTYDRFSSKSAHFVLSDGTLITTSLDADYEGGLWVGIDVNGTAAPNTIGKDTFLFFLSSKYGLKPLGDEGTYTTWRFPYGKYSRDYVISLSSVNACNGQKNGYWCAALIFHDGWQIKEDYPW